MRRPLVGVTVLFVIGILIGLRWDFPVLQIAMLGVLLSLFTIVFPRIPFISVGLWLAVILAGAVHTRLAMSGSSPREIGRLVQRAREHVSLVGVVASEPGVEAARETDLEIRKFEVRVEGMRRAEEWQRARGTVDIWWLAPAGTPLRPASGALGIARRNDLPRASG